MLRFLSILAAFPLLACGPAGDSHFVDKTSSSARDHIMWVNESPVTFGYQRLSALSGIYQDLAVFVSAEGSPDFLAETTKDGKRYLILYYLEKRQAFAVRTLAAHSREVEFSGPYPVTDKENRILLGLRQRSGQSP